MYKNLQHFIKTLDRAGELRRIRTTVSPHLEISRLTDRESKAPNGGKALFFEDVAGSPFAAATNLFGSPRRICLAFGVEDLDELGDRVRSYIDVNPPRNLKDALGLLPMAVGLSRFFPRVRRTGTPPCQEVVLRGRSADLTRLPSLHCWPKDAGRFITLPLVITRSPVTGRRNMGMYRMQIFDRCTTGMHWHIHKDGSHYYGEYARLNRRMPVAVALGADPATVYAATAPMPRGIDELILAGFIRKKPVPMARCITVDLEVPAEAEFVLEGYVDPGELRREGPFGDHTGYYSPADDYPVFHVTAVTHRENPVYAATLVGRPPMEDCYLALATERIFLPMLQTVMPEIRDYWFPWEGVFHNIVVVSIEKAYAGHAQKVMSGLWGQGKMSFCKAIVVVDGTIDPKDPAHLIDLLANRFDPATDITLTMGVLDILDHASPHANFGSKIGIDLTERFPGEPPRSTDTLCAAGSADADRVTAGETLAEEELRDAVTAAIPDAVHCRRLPGRPCRTPARADADESPKDSVNVNINRALAVSIERPDRPGEGDHSADALLGTAALSAFNIFLIFDGDIDPGDNSLVLWKLFNNVDPKRDMTASGRRIVIDARVKGPPEGHHRSWPDALTFEE